MNAKGFYLVHNSTALHPLKVTNLVLDNIVKVKWKDFLCVYNVTILQFMLSITFTLDKDMTLTSDLHICCIIDINIDLYMTLTSDRTSFCITYIDMHHYMTLTFDLQSVVSFI